MEWIRWIVAGLVALASSATTAFLVAAYLCKKLINSALEKDGRKHQAEIDRRLKDHQALLDQKLDTMRATLTADVETHKAGDALSQDIYLAWSKDIKNLRVCLDGAFVVLHDAVERHSREPTVSDHGNDPTLAPFMKLRLAEVEAEPWLPWSLRESLGSLHALRAEAAGGTWPTLEEVVRRKVAVEHELRSVAMGDVALVRVSQALGLPDRMIRVCCVSACRINSPDGRFLLVSNRERRLRGRNMFGPFGGAIRTFKEDCLRRIDARPEQPDTRELRFWTATSKLKTFEKWFRERDGRETNPFRELQEEMVDEEGLLEQLDQIQVTFVDPPLLHTPRRPSDRGGTGNALTQYFFEVFKTELSEDVWHRLTKSLSKDGCTARLVSRDEILNGQTSDGIEIGPDCPSLLL